MNIFNLKQSLKSDIWMMTGNSVKVLEQKLNRLEAGVDWKSELQPIPETKPEETVSTCIINLNGEIVKRLGIPRAILEFVGIQDLDYLDQDIEAVLANDNIKTVIFNISSGGGSVMGLDETGDLLDELDKKTTLVAYTDTLMCSAAYKLASHCSYIYASPSSMVGMIGTYCQRLDITEYLKMNGIKVETFGEGDYKTMYVPEIALTDKQRELFVQEIKNCTSMFQQTVLKKRPAVSMEDMQGQIFYGREAVTKNLIDGNVNSFKTLLGQLK